MTVTVGTLLSDRYRLDAHVGAGGMSTVYRAFDTRLERQVAIKVLHPQGATDADQLERFRREARAVAQLNHPHIVQVIDAGEQDDAYRPTPYIVFEYVEGETLKARIRRHGKLPIGEAIAYTIEIARALGAAHDAGIVHRDVKPQNVLIDEEGSAKVTDFGIARTLDQEGLTADGRVLGTTDYVSPEQALGHAVTGQSDLYSLGIVLYEMLTGDVPFKGENQVAVAMKHVREDLPDVQVRRPEVSGALAAVLDRATAKELDQRYRSDATFVADLEDVLVQETRRTGQATGEATAVLRTLPEQSRRRLPRRVTQPWRLAVPGLLALIAIVGTVVILAQGDRVERGTGTRTPVDVKAPPGLQPISLGQDRASDYDPQGDGGEHSDAAKFVLDKDPNSIWDTERYQGGVLTKTSPPADPADLGVGIYLDAKPGVAARAMSIRTTTPGWKGKIFVARSAVPKTLPSDGWIELADVDATGRTTSIDLDTARQPFRYYLIWITKLPEGKDRAAISEVVLFR
ncbi:protein kinase domain-containing protein [Paraconexibacter algicola]|uniref:non-specific serine/threonine protein kinase n=1 Tax=Paraconexibacter algicola TaxID=2133960 RepID=A0A2T4UJ15_9ACTN|nr:protein kinase [Paraconexibacter algicola]PTL59205.1 serine/threonine protein kinase [Paraconexibacter algicola]